MDHQVVDHLASPKSVANKISSAISSAKNDEAADDTKTLLEHDNANAVKKKKKRLCPRNLCPDFIEAQAAASVGDSQNKEIVTPINLSGGQGQLIAAAESDDCGLDSLQQQQQHEEEEKSKDNKDDNNSDSECDSVQSIRATHGTWDGSDDDDDDVPFHGCVCGEVHARPVPVFWIQCDGPCRAWFNVTPACVGGLTQNKVEHLVSWNCPPCTQYFQKAPSLQSLITLPSEVLFRVLEFTAKRTYRAAVLETQIAPLCRASCQFVKGSKSKDIWDFILQRDYYYDKQTTTKSSSSSSKRKQGPDETRPTRCSKRRRRISYFLDADTITYSESDTQQHNNNPRHLVHQEHFQLLSRIEDAYVAVESLAAYSVNNNSSISNNNNNGQQQQQQQQQDCKPQTLTLQRLRKIISMYQPLDLNRPSPGSGRTFLQVCCAADANETSIVRCVQYLIEKGADPNVFSTKEAPFANRPALYFAIARAMPHLVQIFIDAKACLTTTDEDQQHQNNQIVSGEIKRTFDPSKSIIGTFRRPLDYAREMKRVEVDEQRSSSSSSSSSSEQQQQTAAASVVVSPYWVSKLNACIQRLEEATRKAKAAGVGVQRY